MNDTRIVYRQHPNASPEDELNVLASAYAFVRGCAEMRRSTEKNKGGPDTAPNDAMKGSKHDRANRMLQHG